MDVREKLVELLRQSETEYSKFVNATSFMPDKPRLIADHLIANGVTVQEWISVDDRLPEQNKSVLVYFDSGNMAVGYWYDKDEWLTFWQAWSDDGWITDCDCIPLYWMPLPEPPEMEGNAN